MTAPATQDEQAPAAELPPALQSLPLTLSIRVGAVRMTVSELMALGEGSLVTLDAKVDAPLQVCLEDRVVALGELIETDGGLAVRLTEALG